MKKTPYIHPKTDTIQVSIQPFMNVSTTSQNEVSTVDIDDTEDYDDNEFIIL